MAESEGVQRPCVLWLCAAVDVADPRWRALLKRPELPFIFAQLPNYTLEPDCDWPRLRDEQRRALTLWNTAMAVTEPGVRVAQ